jgi:hypothetical protein
MQLLNAIHEGLQSSDAPLSSSCATTIVSARSAAASRSERKRRGLSAPCASAGQRRPARALVVGVGASARRSPALVFGKRSLRSRGRPRSHCRSHCACFARCSTKPPPPLPPPPNPPRTTSPPTSSTTRGSRSRR